MKTILFFLFMALVVPASYSQEPGTSPQDLFAPGTVWNGKRKFEKENGNLKRKPQDWSLHVTKREGEYFTALMIIQGNIAADRFECEVSGKAPVQGDGPVSFKSEARGDFKQSFYGKIKGGSIALDFKGKAANGESVEGVAALTLKSRKL